MKQPVQWLTAAPLWSTARADEASSERFRRPVLLRFGSDTFMEDLLGALADAPESLAERVARPETWEKPAVGWAGADDPTLGQILKLFQPAHGRFYLAAASLVCRRPGLPCRKPDTAAGDRASMVLRRLVPIDGETIDLTDPETFEEQAWVGDREKGAWRTVGPAVAGDRVLDGEERLPLFALSFELQGKRRCLHAGMIPVGGRELYEGAAPAAVTPDLPDAPDDPLAALKDPRKAVWAAGPAETLRLLANLQTPANEEVAAQTAAVARDLLTFALLDLADLLRDELPGLWHALEQGSRSRLAAADAALYDRFAAPTPWGVAPKTWRTALLAADARREVLLGNEDAPQSDRDSSSVPPVPSTASIGAVRTAARALDGPAPDPNDPSALTLDLFAALGTPKPGPVDPGTPEAAARAAAVGGSEGGLYYLRCVYEKPRCGRLDQPEVSAPSRAFRLASFFDPEAPTRPIQIRLPLDTSVAGLRKFPKGVSVLLSNKLRQQVERVRGASLKNLDEGDVGTAEPSLGLGMICTLSIPIITICALIVLMIFVQLLNIVFWWLPLFKICLPIPVRSDS